MKFIAHSLKLVADGLRSKEDLSLHLFQFVDDFRYTKDRSLVDDMPNFSGLEDKHVALIASTVEYLCREAGIQCPSWTNTIGPLKDPYFVSGIENLKAMAIAESPFEFRKRMVFVLSNFMDRV